MVSKTVEQFIVSREQRQIDLKMVPSDIWGTTAHVLMLETTGIVSRGRVVKILNALADIQRSYEAGNFEIDPERGTQLTLEKEIVSRAGEEAGLSAHTGRSRNDQVMVTELLYLRDEVLLIAQKFEEVIESLINLASQHITTVMPGYTHMQPGKPTTFAHWCLLYACSFRRILDALLDRFKRYDLCPLGSVESFGTSWPLDREYTANLLGFSAVWDLPLDAISHRGYFQLELLQVFSMAGIELSRIASDLLQYTTFEYGLVDLGDQVAERLHPITGSSVMAQKRNPDALEVLRATGNQLNSFSVAAVDLLSGLPAGYNRDSREIKEYIDPALRKVSTGLEVLLQVVSTLVVKSDRMLELVNANYSLTTDLADFVAQYTDLPYRMVYKVVGEAVKQLIDNNNPLSELTVERLKEIGSEKGLKVDIPKEELHNILNPAVALAKRTHIGGTASIATKQIISKEESALKKLAALRLELFERIKLAKDKTQLAVAKVVREQEEGAA